MSQQYKCHGFLATIYCDASMRLESVARSIGVDPKLLMRDYAIVESVKNTCITVGDMADNLTGRSYVDAGLARQIGLPDDYAFNGGLIGSNRLSRSLPGCTQNGTAFIDAANRILRAACDQYGYDTARLRPEDRFTGYIARIMIEGSVATITSVGDVCLWVNGRLVAGAEKQVDTEKSRLIRDLAQLLPAVGADGMAAIRDRVRRFAVDARMDNATAAKLCAAIECSVKVGEPLDMQTVYRPVDDIATPWQIRTLQNRPHGSHPWAYGAIDGTDTPEEYITTGVIEVSDIQNIVIATDGSRPRSPRGTVRSVSDLTAVDRTYGEQTIMVLARDADCN